MSVDSPFDAVAAGFGAGFAAGAPSTFGAGVGLASDVGVGFGAGVGSSTGVISLELVVSFSGLGARTSAGDVSALFSVVGDEYFAAAARDVR